MCEGRIESGWKRFLNFLYILGTRFYVPISECQKHVHNIRAIVCNVWKCTFLVIQVLLSVSSLFSNYCISLFINTALPVSCCMLQIPLKPEQNLYMPVTGKQKGGFYTEVANATIGMLLISVAGHNASQNLHSGFSQIGQLFFLAHCYDEVGVWEKEIPWARAFQPFYYVFKYSFSKYHLSLPPLVGAFPCNLVPKLCHFWRARELHARYGWCTPTQPSLPGWMLQCPKVSLAGGPNTACHTVE